ncbi:farnesol dehydrogenase-like [Topomyia yanbarensis]|uniref:farnesol dehydrogenase-like n=1 Tax=Topomyia yanbarensis TaxID=2498891 RepID=UPI00273AF2FA|nr:farnesol dehydrogenase-like [Topomyia yanbarensis]XP_058838957.1 farnesol dehydrogenase-like [Topomyia yanbarensis]
MDRWVGKVAVVTGASAGIGAVIAEELAKAGMITIGLARRVERVEALKAHLPVESSIRLHALNCDVSKKEDIREAFQQIREQFGGIDVLINNAGIVKQTALFAEDDGQALKEILDTNVLGLTLCSREAFKSMKQRSVAGHIVHINSIAGHKVLPFPHMNMYAASKYAVTAITETMRNELREMHSKVKVTSISPGVVKTEIVAGLEDHKDFPKLECEDIANAVLYVLGTPERVQIHELIIKPVGEQF